MAKGLITHAYLEDTADAIRVLRGESDTYTPDEFGEKILNAIPDVTVTDSIVSVTDAAAYPAEKLEFAIEPVQDLHGYDKPWPAGGGKNLLNVTATTQTVNGVTYTVNNDGSVNIKRTSSSSNNSTIKISDVTITGECKLSCGVVPSWNENGFIFGARSSSSVETQVSSLDGTTLAAGTYEIYITTQYNKDPNLTIYPMIRLSSVADYTFEPYSNICPISGWTAVDGERTGVNLVFDKISGANISSDGTISASSEFDVQLAKIKAGETYCISTDLVSKVYSFYTTKPIIGSVSYNGERIVTETLYFTAPITGYVAFRSSNGYETPQLELGNQATTYEPYTGTSIPITFPTEAGTVYGGKVDVVKGKLTVNYASVDLGTLSWSVVPITTSNIRYIYLSISHSISNCNGNGNYNVAVSNAICSTYMAVPRIRIMNGITGFQLEAGSAYLYDAQIDDISLSDLELLNKYIVAMQGVQLVYELATPIEYDITPQQVMMLLGNNNIWCDTGDTTLEYKVDLSRYIAKLQASQTPQLSLSRQAVSLDVGPITQEIKADVSERNSAEAEEQEEQQQGGDAD